MKRAPAGFTLIEVLVAMSIFAITSAATASMMLHSTATVAANNGASQAITLAQQAMEDFRARAYQDMANGSDVVTWKGISFTITSEVYEDDLDPGMKTIVVTVSWQEKGVARTYATQSIYAQVNAQG